MKGLVSTIYVRPQIQASAPRPPTAKTEIGEPNLRVGAELAQALVDLAEVEEALAQVTAERETLNDELNLMIEEHQSLQADLEGTVYAFRKRLDSTDTQLSAAKNQYELALGWYGTILGDLDQAQQQIQDLNGELDAVNKALSNSNQELSRVEAAFDHLRTQVDGANKYLAVAARYFEWVFLVKMRQTTNADLALALSLVTAATEATEDEKLIDTWDEFVNPSGAYTPTVAEAAFMIDLAPHLIVQGAP